MDARRPSVAAMISADYAALLCFLAPVVCWVLYALWELGIWRDPREGESGGMVRLVFAVIVTAVGVPLLVRRVGRLRALLRDGVEVPGRVVGAWFSRDRGRIEYEYEYEGRTYRRGMALAKSKRTAALTEGREILVRVDPADPERSTVPEAFG